MSTAHGSGAVMVFVLAGVAWGQIGTGPEESPGDTPAATGAARVGPAMRVPAPDMPNNSPSVQVNVNPQGMNILGDAANEPSIAVDPTAPNRMVIGWRQFDSITSNFREAGYAWTNDGGRTWHKGEIESGTFRSDPVLDAAADGTFYYYSLVSNFDCHLFTSTDGGRTWPRRAYGYGGDKNWFTVDRSPSLGRGHIYGIWKPFLGCCGDRYFTRSVDAGAVFQPPVNSVFDPIRGTVAVGPDGEVYVAGEEVGGFAVVRSDNARLAGSTPTFALERAVSLGGFLAGYAGPNPGGILAQAWIDVDRSAGPRRGHVYLLCSVDPPSADPCETMFARSTDGGATWSAPVRVHDDTPGLNAWQWFGTMSVAPDGRIDVVWNDTRNFTGFTRSELHYTFSADGGLTWEPNARLSTDWHCCVGYPNQNKIGDYYHMRSDLVGADLAWAATFNGEQDVYYLRIGDRDCNQNGIGDAQDLTNGFAQDCNTNTIPDSCEIAAGAVADANNNGIPDPCECYPDCDPSTGPRVLDIFDLLCFQNRYDAQDPYACDCDVSTGPGVCDVFDFLCFQNAYDAGCP